MIDPDTRYNELIARLREYDYRLTPQRMALVRLIAASEGHPSAAQLYSQIRAQFPTMSQATVYKTLALLKEMGQVLEIGLRDDHHYDGKKPYPHPHLICLKCNQIMDGEIDLDPVFIQKLERLSGYQIIRSQVLFYGLCPACRSKE